MRGNTRQIGTEKERIAQGYLEAIGYRIVECNYRCRMGEIDLIGLEDEILSFIEVKYRKSEEFGDPTLAVNYKKRQTICRVASYFLLTHPVYRGMQCRFDIVAILPREIRLYRNAFSVC